MTIEQVVKLTVKNMRANNFYKKVTGTDNIDKIIQKIEKDLLEEFKFDKKAQEYIKSSLKLFHLSSLIIMLYFYGEDMNLLTCPELIYYPELIYK